MAKINWGTTAEVLGGVGTKVAQKMGQKKQATKYDSTGAASSDPSGGSDASATYVPSYKKGGKVRKTGLARLHKGERVLNRKQTKKYDSGKR